MRGVPRENRTAARLRYVADQKAGPNPFRLRLTGDLLDRRDEFRMAPVAVSRQAHHLPGVAIDAERGTAREAAGE